MQRIVRLTWDPTILLYHRVCGDGERSSSEFAVNARVFREQMRYLSRCNYYTPRLSEVLAGNGAAARDTKTPVLLTFDDGYTDNLENALPILKEFGFTAAIFPVLDLTRRSTWWGDARGASLLRAEQIRSMETARIEFGSHCVTHRPLTSLSDSELIEELTRSREVLATIVAHPLPVLAYPFGDVDERVKRATQRAGYAAALAVNSGPLDLRSDVFEIRRLLVANRSHAAYMRMKLSGAEKLYRWLKWKIRTAVS